MKLGAAAISEFLETHSLYSVIWAITIRQYKEIAPVYSRISYREQE
jgi:hypothetical protein